MKSEGGEAEPLWATMTHTAPPCNHPQDAMTHGQVEWKIALGIVHNPARCLTPGESALKRKHIDTKQVYFA